MAAVDCGHAAVGRQHRNPLVATLAYLLLTLAGQPNRSFSSSAFCRRCWCSGFAERCPEPAEWQAAKDHADQNQPRFIELFRGPVRRTTLVVVLVCATSLTAHWAFMFWFLQHLRTAAGRRRLDRCGEESGALSVGMAVVMVTSIVGNFLAGAIASRIGYRPADRRDVPGLFRRRWSFGYGVARDLDGMWIWLAAVGICQGVFALFTMYLPPLFPTLLRTTGAGFCYNIGRIAAAAGTVYFGSFSKAGDYRLALLYAAFSVLPAAAFALLLPELPMAEKN